eukprot:CAMPEP_0176345336 /NCGR_PEP_ID=MMETSP0126-20121128/5378_1 /TAXON_ID=141414 ORGANISM="Strombidinopsis acuminatum, Strain SPMC142" /NCGR_SAMPLE_ID=MMETSP0126 /ASSEMBLY_ACC=CAM_ASM_000229 /LENGTH=88 /DNA_ID=CAMNT_0017692255 /DNA_START=593 /DNA_END=859 /DNA_ORIENTATION=+
MWPQGSYFGEIEILFGRKRICSAAAAENCDLFTLSKKKYLTKIKIDYPDIHENLKEIALERYKRILVSHKQAQKVLSHLGGENQEPEH